MPTPEAPIPAELGPGPEVAAPPEIAAFGTYPMEERMYVDLLALAEVQEGPDALKELREVVEEALAFREGVAYGLTNYNLENEAVLLNLQNNFTTVEEATQRPQAPYLAQALRMATRGKIQELMIFGGMPSLWERMMLTKMPLPDRSKVTDEDERRRLEQADQLKRMNLLEETRKRMEKTREYKDEIIALENTIDGRRVMFEANIQRWETCEDPATAADLLAKDRHYRPPVTPDKGHWRGFFSGEWGEAVNDAFWDIASFALDDRVIKRLGLDEIPPDTRRLVRPETYALGFDSSGVFKAWLEHLLGRRGGRLDQVQAAWRLFLTTETLDTISEYVKVEKKIKSDGTEEEKKKYILAIPPLGNALHTFISHLRVKRRIEWGIDPDGNRTQVAKYPSHSGLPMSIDKIPNLCLGYFHQCKLQFDRQALLSLEETIRTLVKNLPEAEHPDYNEDYGKMKSDLEKMLANDSHAPKTVDISLWDLGLYGRLSFADEKFPWALTEISDVDRSPGELASGTFGFWLLTRKRAQSVLEDIKSRPSLKDLGDPDFFAQRIRNWEKVLGKLDTKTESADSPRAQVTLGWLFNHIPGTDSRGGVPAVKNRPWANFRTRATSQALGNEKPGQGSPMATQIGDVLLHAVNCGWLRTRDAEWIRSQLSMPRLASPV